MPKPTRGLILNGSSRSNRPTSLVSDEIKIITGFDSVNLNEMNFSYYDYEHENSSDDFLPFVRSLVEKYDVVVCNTPVYWYTMSAVMKTFFDRISDCLNIDKETGRKLRGKHMAVISNRIGSKLNEHFEMPFEESAKYLGLHYLGHSHMWFDGEHLSKVAIAELRKIDFLLHNKVQQV